jgi:hypothetical protein
MPAQHSKTASAGVVSIYKQEAERHRNFAKASSALTTALLTSLGETNQVHIRTAFPTLKPYMLTPRNVVDTIMQVKRGIATSEDVSTLEEPLSRVLKTSLSNLEGHLSLFLLASQRLTRSGQGETDYKYFNLS